MSRPSTSQPTDPYASEAARTEAVDHPLLGSPRTSTDDLPAHSPSQTPASSSSSTAAPTHNAQVYFDAGQALDAHPDRLYDASQPGSAVSGEPSSSAPSAPSASLDSLSPPPQPRTRLDTVRLALGKFGRFVGMRVPGAFYTSVSQADDDGSSHHPRRRVVGSGLGQDGVFSNMNAKPERRRRRQPNAGMEGDRGEDDDLADDEEVPPSYAAAAADAVPPYWETTMMGGLAHPLAPGGNGWTPGSPTVGAVEDLIIEGLPVGNLFGLLWNLLVSVSFQFVGFLLTYLLHTTHAAKAGSRAGLGITLVQYGLALRSSAEKLRSDSPNNGSGTEDSAAKAQREQEMGSADWLSMCLMSLGGVVILLSTVSYIRLWRFGRNLVKAAQREQQDTEAAMATDAETIAAQTSNTHSAEGEPSAMSMIFSFMNRNRQQGDPYVYNARQDGERWAVPSRVFQLEDR